MYFHFWCRVLDAWIRAKYCSLKFQDPSIAAAAAASPLQSEPTSGGGGGGGSEDRPKPPTVRVLQEAEGGKFRPARKALALDVDFRSDGEEPLSLRGMRVCVCGGACVRVRWVYGGLDELLAEHEADAHAARGDAALAAVHALGVLAARHLQRAGRPRDQHVLATAHTTRHDTHSMTRHTTHDTTRA